MKQSLTNQNQLNQKTNPSTGQVSLSFQLIREIIQDLQKPDSSFAKFENHLLKLINNTQERDASMVFQFVIQVQKLHALSIQDQFFAEQHSKSCQAQILQLLNTITDKVNLMNLTQSLRFLRICSRIEKQAIDKVLVLNAKLLNERMLIQLGKSCQYFLKGLEQANLQTLITTFIRIADGIQDNDFDELYAMQALGIVFKELANLLILLDPCIAQLIKSNLSVNLKSQLSKPIMPIAKGQAIFKLIETLLQGNPEYFIDFLDTLKKHLFSNQHSIQKGLAYQTLVNCTEALVEYLRNDKFKQEFYLLYNEIAAQTTIDNTVQPHKLQQIQEVVGHFVSLENIYSEYSDNKLILNLIAEFNFKLSQSQVQFQLMLQKSIKKCMKNLLIRVDFPIISKTYQNYIGIVDPDIRNSMILHLINEHQLAFVTQILYNLEDVSQLVWESFIKEYLIIKGQDEVMEGEMKKLILFNGFQWNNLIALLNCECYQLFIQLCNINYDSLSFEHLMEILFIKLGDQLNQHILELICSLLILRLDRSNIFEYNIFLKLIQMNIENELMLHYIQTISNKIESDELLSLLSQCQPSQLIYTIINDNILKLELNESDLDLLLYIVQKQNLVNDEFYANLMDLLALKQEYAIALFNIAAKQNIPQKLTFYMAQKIANQSYYNEDVNQQLEFHFQQNLQYMIELCQFTYQAAQSDPCFIEQQIEYFEGLLDTQKEEFVEETTRIIKFYLTNFPEQTCLSKLIPKYQYLYNHGKPELTQTLILIVPDLIEIIEILLEHHADDQVDQLFCKLIQLPLYAEFAECLEKYQLKFNLKPLCKVFNRFRDRFGDLYQQLKQSNSKWKDEILQQIE